MSKYNILHIVATGRLSGAEKVVSDICTNLDERFKAFAVCSGEELTNYYQNKGIEGFIADVNKLNPKEITKIRSIIKENNINLVHGHDIKASIAGYLAAKNFNIPVVSHMHASYQWMSKPSPLKIMDRYFRKKYNLSIAVSEMAKKYYIEHNPRAREEKIITMNNAFNFNELRDVLIQDKNVFKSQLGIENGVFIYGFLGRLLEIKGVDLLIDSFNEVNKKHKGTILMIVGDGPERSKLEEKARSYNLQDKLIFTGFQKNVYDYMNIFDSFILPSVTEGLPIAVLEAMAMKKAVISTPVAGLKDLVENEYNGLILKERSVEELTKNMIRVYEDEELRHSIEENSYNRLINNYNIEDYISRLQKIYVDLIERE